MSTHDAVAHEIGWHQHGRSWVWGVLPYDGCGLCDLAETWLRKQDEWLDEVTIEIASRAKLTLVEPVHPPPVQYIDPHKPAAVAPEDEPAIEKIKRGKPKKKEPEPEPEMMFERVVAMAVPDNEIDEMPPPQPPAPVAAPTFKLTNPDQYTIKRNRRRR